MMNPPDKKPAIKTGAPDHEDVNLILRLYELRREPVMREARHFMTFEFFPKSHEEVMGLVTSRPSQECVLSPKYRAIGRWRPRS